MASKFLLEDNVFGVLLEDGASYLLLEGERDNPLWRLAPRLTAIALAACAPADYSQPAPQYWPWQRVVLGSGAVPAAQRPAAVLVRADHVRPPAPQGWPFWRAAAAAQPPQNLLRYPPKAPPQIEAAEIPRPAALEWVFGQSQPAAQPGQPFSLWFKGARVDVSIPDEQRRHDDAGWPFYPPVSASGVIPAVAPTQPILVKRDEIGRAAPLSWPFGRTQAPPTATPQPFGLLYRAPRVTIEPEPWSPPTVFGLVVMGPAAASPQSFHFLLAPHNRAPIAIDESQRQRAPDAWPFGRAIASAPVYQPFSIWHRPVRPTFEPEPWSVLPSQARVFASTVVASPQSFHFLLAAARPRAPVEQPELAQAKPASLFAFGRVVPQPPQHWFLFAARPSLRQDPDVWRTVDLRTYPATVVTVSSGPISGQTYTAFGPRTTTVNGPGEATVHGSAEGTVFG